VPGDPIHAEAFAKDCGIMAGILQDAIAEDAKALHADDERAEQLGTALRQKGVSFRQIVYLKGTDRCRIELYGCAHAEDAATRRQLQRMVQDETSLALRAPSYDGSGEEEGLILLQSRPCLSVKCAFRSLAAGVGISPAPQESPTKKAPGCGDSVRFFSDNRERFYALLCDGMGCGEAAALTSGISVLLLERMLRAGVGVDSAMTMLNHYLFSRIGECSESTSTVDLLTIDLYSGKARFIKSGAADSLLLRDGQLYTIGCRTFPLGALSGVDVQVIPFPLQAGDHILLMSDGVADVLEHEPSRSVQTVPKDVPVPDITSTSNWLYDMLTTPPLDNDAAVQELLERILRTARERGSVDDMTVAMLRVMGE
jgi:stage II sporulation protein E